jgi:ATP dependent DNA ligase C terminal region
MPPAEPPPRDSRFGSPLELSRVHWVRPEMVVEVTYLTWTEDNLLRQVSYQGPREDKPARQVVRPVAACASASRRALLARAKNQRGNISVGLNHQTGADLIIGVSFTKKSPRGLMVETAV